MTGLDLVVIVVSAALTLRVWVRGLRAGMQREREELEAFRAALGIPEDRRRIVDVGLVEAALDALVPSRRLPRFQDVWRLPARPVPVEEVAADGAA